MRFHLPVCLAVMLTIAAPSMAQTGFQSLSGERDAKVVLDLKAEGWIETKSALVRAVIEAAFPSGQSGAVRTQSLDALRKVAPQGDWHITRFDQLPDPSGLERWRISAEARLEEAQTQGLRDRAQSAGRSGLKVTIESVDFVPTVAEREAALALLRQQIYRDAKAEIDRLNAVAAPQNYAIRQIDFQPDRVMTDRPPAAFARSAPVPMAADASAGAAGGVDLAQKAVVRALVTLATKD